MIRSKTKIEIIPGKPFTKTIVINDEHLQLNISVWHLGKLLFEAGLLDDYSGKFTVLLLNNRQFLKFRRLIDQYIKQNQRL